MRNTEGKTRILSLISNEAKALLEAQAFQGRTTMTTALELSIKLRAKEILTQAQYRQAQAKAVKL